MKIINDTNVHIFVCNNLYPLWTMGWGKLGLSGDTVAVVGCHEIYLLLSCVIMIESRFRYDISMNDVFEAMLRYYW